MLDIGGCVMHGELIAKVDSANCLGFTQAARAAQGPLVFPPTIYPNRSSHRLDPGRPCCSGFQMLQQFVRELENLEFQYQPEVKKLQSSARVPRVFPLGRFDRRHLLPILGVLLLVLGSRA